MKKSIITKLILILLISIFTSLLIINNHTIVEASLLNVTKGTNIKTGEVASNIEYASFNGTTTTDGGTTSNQRFSYVKAKTGSSQVVTWSKFTQNGIVLSNVLDIAKDYELNHPGYKVVAGINGDYFSGNATINANLVDNNLVKYDNHAKYQSLAIKKDLSSYKLVKTNKVSTNYYLTVYDDNNVLLKELKLDNLNSLPNSDQTTFFFRYTSNLTDDAATMFEIASPISSFNASSIYIKGCITSEVTSTSSNPTIVTKNKEVSDLLKVYKNVKIQKNLIGDNLGYENAIGVGSQPLRDGNILINEQIVDQNISFCEARHPRSSVGFTETGDIVIATIDGRQSNIAGASLREEAAFMQMLGCVDCFNFDGGGSTELVIKTDNTFSYLNSPSERYRAVANALLIVVPDVNYQIELTKADTTTMKISKDVNDTIIKNERLFVNGKEIPFTTALIELTDLNEKDVNYISILTTYEKDNIIYTNTLLQEKFVLNEEEEKKVKPTDFVMTFALTENGFDAIVNCYDKSETLTKVYLKTIDGKEVAIKDGRGYCVNYTIDQTKNYEFTIIYYYRIDTLNPIEETYEQKFTYIYVLSKPSDFKINFVLDPVNKGFKLEINYETNESTVNEIVLKYKNTQIIVDETNVVNFSNSSTGEYAFTIECKYTNEGGTFTKTIPDKFVYNFKETSESTASSCKQSKSKTGIYVASLIGSVSILLYLLKKKH